MSFMVKSVDMFTPGFRITSSCVDTEYVFCRRRSSSVKQRKDFLTLYYIIIIAPFDLFEVS